MEQEDIPLREAQQTTLARVLAAQRKYGQALLVLDQLYTESDQAGRKECIIETQILKALIFHAQQRQREAFVTLEEALKLAEPEHYIRIFADERKPMAVLLHKYMRYKSIADFLEPVMNRYIEQLLAARGKPSANPAEQEKSPEQELLTNREIEIYLLLETGHTNQQIAKKLFISENTVKTHRKSIYAKLEVNNRAQMIKKAKEMNLI